LDNFLKKGNSLYKLLFLGIVFLFSGCSDTPKKTVLNIFEALEEGDLATISRESSLKTSGYFSMYALKKCDLPRDKYKDNELELLDKCIKIAYTDTKLESLTIDILSENEAIAHVVTKSHNQKQNHTWKVLKIEEDWKLYVEGKEKN